jgi:hypothetical protein
MILFLKSSPDDDGDNKMPLHEKLILIFKQRIEDATTDQDRERAERDLEKLEADTSVG